MIPSKSICLVANGGPTHGWYQDPSASLHGLSQPSRAALVPHRGVPSSVYAVTWLTPHCQGQLNNISFFFLSRKEEERVADLFLNPFLPIPEISSDSSSLSKRVSQSPRYCRAVPQGVNWVMSSEFYFTCWASAMILQEPRVFQLKKWCVKRVKMFFSVRGKTSQYAWRKTLRQDFKEAPWSEMLALISLSSLDFCSS